MDIIFGTFAATQLEHMSEPALLEYDTLLRQYDNDLYNWIVARHEAPSDVAQLSAFQQLLTFVKDNRELMSKSPV